jgi:hypothetical protein
MLIVPDVTGTSIDHSLITDQEAPVSRKPDFMIIGSPKAGTTYLFDLLAQHSGVYPSTPKEPSFFSLPDRYKLGMSWYSQLFAGASSGQISGEGSTHYADGRFLDVAIPRIRRDVPEARLIYLIRDPVDRLVSHYRFFIQEVRWSKANYLARVGDFPDDYRYFFDEHLFCMQDFVDPDKDFVPTFDEFLQMFDGAMLKTSLYGENLEFILTHFPRRQVLVLLAEDLFEGPERVLSEVFEFLELKPERLKTDMVVNEYQSSVMLAEQNRLRRQLLNNAFVSWAARMLVPTWAKSVFWQFWKALGSSRVGPESKVVAQPGSDALQEIRAGFVDDIAKVEQLLNRDLTRWKSG